MWFHRYSRHGRRAASEAIGAVLAIAITLIAGTAAWSYVRNQAGASEVALQGGALNTNNYLSEHFTVPDMYYPSTTSMTFWVYNTGAVTYQAFSVRFYGSTAGSVNLLFNFTQNGAGVKTDYVYDLTSSLATKCKLGAGSYETPSVSAALAKTTNAQLYTLTVPPALANCPSFGQTFVAGTTYTIIVTGIFGNVVTHSQTK